MLQPTVPHCFLPGPTGRRVYDLRVGINTTCVCDSNSKSFIASAHISSISSEETNAVRRLYVGNTATMAMSQSEGCLDTRKVFPKTQVNQIKGKGLTLQMNSNKLLDAGWLLNTRWDEETWI